MILRFIHNFRPLTRNFSSLSQDHLISVRFWREALAQRLAELTKKAALRPTRATPEVLLSILEPVANSVTHAQPRVRWYPLTDLPTGTRLQAIINRGEDTTRFEISSSGDFFFPASLEKGAYTLCLWGKTPDGEQIISRRVPFTVDWDRANEGRIDCTHPWQRLFLLGKNRVRPCCMLKEGVIFATNANDKQADLWNNHGLVELRDALRKGNGRFCHTHCPYYKEWDNNDDVQSRRLDSYRRGDVYQHTPLKLKISLGSRCNHRCTFCKMGSSEYRHWDQQDYAFEYLLRNAGTLKQLSLTGGEPLVHFKRYRARLERAFALAPDLRLKMQTNGALIHKYIDALRAVPSLTLSVSMAGANRKDYLALHRVDDFDSVCANLKAIREARGRKPTTIEIKMVYTKKNYRGVPDFPGVAHEVGANQVYFHHLMVLARTDIDPADEIKPGDPEHTELIAGLAQAKSRADQYGLQMRVTNRDHKKVREFNTKGVVDTDEDALDD